MKVESTSKCNITKKIEETLFWGVKVEFFSLFFVALLS